MPGTGTIINCAAVVAGGILGLLLKKGLPERFQNILICVCGLSTLFMGISGTLKEMFTVENGMLQTHGTLMIIFSLVFGALTGEPVSYTHLSTGHEEISLSSLSSSDYTKLEGIVNFLIDEFDGKGVNVSLPSLRIDAFSLDVMSKVQDVKKSSLTFAPEAGSQRLRNVINKGLTEEDIINGSTEAVSYTHLDVYKRQFRGSTAPFPPRK